VIGDFNDDLGSSTHAGSPHPVRPAAGRPRPLRFATQALSDSHTATTVAFRSTIDHHFVSASLYARYVPDSATVLKPDAWVAGYGTNTSDHYPVLNPLRPALRRAPGEVAAERNSEVKVLPGPGSGRDPFGR